MSIIKIFFQVNDMEIPENDLIYLERLSNRQQEKLKSDIKYCEFENTDSIAEKYVEGKISAEEVFHHYRIRGY